LAVLFGLMLLAGAAIVIAISINYLDIEGEQHGEFYALILFATVGMLFLACTYDLLALFISLELMSMCFYVLVAFTKRQKRANEASMKYFLLSVFSSGLLLYGMSLLYGVGGSTNLGDIAVGVNKALSASSSSSAVVSVKPLLVLSMISMAAGLFFKIAAAPFHMWAPDAYEGAPTPITAFLSTGSKAASFALFARIFLGALSGLRDDWAPLLGAVAALTILIGNWAAITQQNSKRLLAYSSVSNAGYLLLGLIAGNQYGYIGLFVYLLVYTFMNLGAFGLIISLRRRGIVGDQVDDFAGLAKKEPLAAFCMSVFMLSLGGLPITGGFMGKYFLFGGLIKKFDSDRRNWYIWLATWALLNTVVSFYYYVRFIKAMYLGEETVEQPQLAMSLPLKVSLAVCLVGVILIGIYPQPVIGAAQRLLASQF
jgi:NADH-quinone oxidoreductase subunit N